MVCHNQGRLLHYTPTPFSLSQRPSFASFRMLQFIIGQTVLTQRLAIHWGRRSQLSSWRAETPGQGGSPPSCGNSSSGPSLGLGAGQCHNFTTSCHHNCFQIRHQKYNFHRELSIEQEDSLVVSILNGRHPHPGIPGREYAAAAFLSRRHLPWGIGCHTVAQTQLPKLDLAKKNTDIGK